MRSSLEDPSQPDVIHQRIVRSSDFISDNSPGGAHEQQLSRAVIVFLYTFWETEIRPCLITAKGAEVKSDVMGELRIIRHAILHSKSILSGSDHLKLKLFSNVFSPGKLLSFDAILMNQIFVLVKQDMAKLMFDHLGIVDAPVHPDQIRDFAIQKNRSSETHGTMR